MILEYGQHGLRGDEMKCPAIVAVPIVDDAGGQNDVPQVTEAHE